MVCWVLNDCTCCGGYFINFENLCLIEMSKNLMKFFCPVNNIFIKFWIGFQCDYIIFVLLQLFKMILLDIVVQIFFCMFIVLGCVLLSVVCLNLRKYPDILEPMSKCHFLVGWISFCVWIVCEVINLIVFVCQILWKQVFDFYKLGYNVSLLVCSYGFLNIDVKLC